MTFEEYEIEEKKWVKLEEKDHGDESIDAIHPWSSLTFAEVETEIFNIKAKYPEYMYFRYDYCYKPTGFGGEVNWWELQGKKRLN